MLVADASVVVAGLAEGTSRGVAAREVLRRAESLHAPHLLDLEVASAVRRLVSGRVVSHEDADRAMAALPGMPIRCYEHVPFLGRVWSFRDNLTPYDAAYVALAEALEAQVVTTDARFTGAAGPRCGFRLLTDWTVVGSSHPLTRTTAIPLVNGSESSPPEPCRHRPTR